MSKGGATCECGQVMFDVASRKAGDTLECPWCERKYRYLGDDKIEKLDKDGKAEPKKDEAKKKPESERRPAPDKEEKSEKADKDKSEKKSERRKKSESERREKAEDRASKRLEKADKDEKDGDKDEDDAPKIERIGAKAATRKEPREPGVGEVKRTPTKAPKQIPGGVTMMIVFIIAFNALAFIIMGLLLPTQENKTRLPVWGGDPIPKSAVWPELLALLFGHVVGFLAWSWYVYQLHKIKEFEKQLAAQSQGGDGREKTEKK